MEMNNETQNLLQEIQRLKEENESLKKENNEYEAVETYIMDKLKHNCQYEDVLKAHYREGQMIDGVWVDDEEDEE